MDHNEIKKRKNNPIETANFLSVLTFAYTARLFKKAFRNDLEEEDLYEVLSQCSSKRCGNKMEEEWIIQHKKDVDQPVSLLKLLWIRYGWRYLSMGLIQLAYSIFSNIAEPWALSNLISYFTPGQTDVTKYDAYFYAMVIIFIYLVGCIYLHNYILMVVQLGIEIKTSFSSILYRKVLKLTPSAISDISLGNIVTLITKDVQTFQQAVWIVNDTWIGLVQLIVFCYLLYARIGVLSFVGVATLLSVTPLQIFIGKYVSTLRLLAGKKTDERLQITQETLSAMRIIKMYTWEKFFGDKVTAARKTEMNKMISVFYLRLVIVILGILFSKIGLYALIMAYVWSGGIADSKTIFYILSIFRQLRQVVDIYIPHGMGKTAEVYSAMVRLNRVLNGQELQPKTGSDEPTSKLLMELKSATVHIKDIEILKNISLKIDSGLTLITGTVGSGKSSLLKTLLQDYPLTKGSVVTHGRISYASQDPWLFPSSIRQNITFGQPFDERRYQDVVTVCALEYDFSLFHKGDQTIVTDKGLNLSKGQQARVNLARAIYKDSEIYLLDDSLTALDAHVQDYIFNECIKKYLKNKICILVTQTAGHIQEADYVIIMDKGQIKSYGKPDEQLIMEINEIVVEDDDLEKEVVKGKDDDMYEPEDEKKKLMENENTTKKKVYSEVKKKGKVDISTYKKYCLFGGGILLITFNIFLCGSAQVSESYSDQLLTKWVDQQHDVLLLRENISHSGFDKSIRDRLNNSTLETGKRSVTSNIIFKRNNRNVAPQPTNVTSDTIKVIMNLPVTVTESTYSNLKDSLATHFSVKTPGNPNFTHTKTFELVSERMNLPESTKVSLIYLPEITPKTALNGSVSISDVTGLPTIKIVSPASVSFFSTKTVSSSIDFSNISTTTAIPLDMRLDIAIATEQRTIKIYSIMIFVSIGLLLLKTYAVFDYCRRASVNIHKAMIGSTINAVMFFYDDHFIGNVLNRFSQDLNNIDEILPFVFGEIFRVTFSVTGIAFLIVSVNFHFLVHAFVFMIIIYILRIIYMPTGRSLKRLEAATRSPMIGHLNASLDGLTTIRAYKAQEILADEFDRHQDLYTSAHYTSICASRALGLFIDFFCTVLIASIVVWFLLIDRDNTAGNVGLALTQVFMLAGHVQWGVRQWAELENLMTSVERLLEYTEIKSENKQGVEVEHWPINGVVKYQDVSLTYNNNERVLKNLNFTIESKQKIGIVGRTGAGKSSIISTLFRLYDVEGKIFIDGVNTKSVALQYLRKKIGIIPQDPVLFSGTVRTNLDPFGEYTDEDLWKSLDKVGLRQTIKSLDVRIKGSDLTFSSGQKQLLCLARAILRSVKIIILDEATANMDHETDAMLRQTVKENFSDCTVFFIAHRLHSILECDKVMVLNRGEIKEFDRPVALLENKGGIFYKMVEQAKLLDYLS